MRDISILFSTWKRPDTLRQTLDGLCALDTGAIDWDVTVVDNAGDRDTQDLLSCYARRLPLRSLVETRPGKNAALNAGIASIDATLVVLTDDDVVPDAGWLCAYHDGAARWPSASVYCGRILPSVTLPFDLDMPFVRGAYVVADWNLPEGPCGAERVWGPNMAIRGELFRAGVRFEETIGPKGTDYAMGSESELVRRLLSSGHIAAFLPESQVTHLIRPAQLSEAWLRSRVVRAGRGAARLDEGVKGPTWGGVPRWLYREVATRWVAMHACRALGGSREALEARLQYEYVKGYLRESRILAGQDS